MTDVFIRGDQDAGTHRGKTMGRHREKTAHL